MVETSEKLREAIRASMEAGYSLRDIISMVCEEAVYFPDSESNSSKVVKSIEKISEYELKLKVTEIMQAAKIPANVKGYDYIRYAIICSFKEPAIKKQIVRKLYPIIAEEFNVTVKQVESSIRHALLITCRHNNFDTLEKYLGYAVNWQQDYPTSGELLNTIVDNLRLKYELT